MRPAIAGSDSTWFRGANHVRGQTRIAAIRVNGDQTLRLTAHPTATELKEKLAWFTDNRPLLLELAQIKARSAEDDGTAAQLSQRDPPIVIPMEPDHHPFDDACPNDAISPDSNDGSQILDFGTWI
jgi:hypothetical protein